MLTVPQFLPRTLVRLPEPAGEANRARGLAQSTTDHYERLVLPVSSVPWSPRATTGRTQSRLNQCRLNKATWALRQRRTGTGQHWASGSPSVNEQMDVSGSGPPHGGVTPSLGTEGPREESRPDDAPLGSLHGRGHRAPWHCSGDPETRRSSRPRGPQAPPTGAPGYSRQNLRKSDCSSFRAFRNILPFSVPTTKALSSCTATQATSAFSLDSAEHYGREQGA